MSPGNTPSQRPASHLVIFLFLRDIDLKVYVWWLVPAVTPPAPQPSQLEALLSTLPDTDGHYGEASHHLFSLDTDGHSCVLGLGVVKGVVYGQVELVTVEKMGRGGVAVAA